MGTGLVWQAETTKSELETLLSTNLVRRQQELESQYASIDPQALSAHSQQKRQELTEAKGAVDDATRQLKCELCCVVLFTCIPFSRFIVLGEFQFYLSENWFSVEQLLSPKSTRTTRRSGTWRTPLKNWRFVVLWSRPFSIWTVLRFSMNAGEVHWGLFGSFFGQEYYSRHVSKLCLFVAPAESSQSSIQPWKQIFLGPSNKRIRNVWIKNVK